MKLQTPIKLTSSSLNLLHSDTIMTFGSCFVENLSAHLSKLKIKCISNPSGITFNPHSISKTINYVVSGHKFIEQEIMVNDDTHFHFDFHGSFKSNQASKTLNVINEHIDRANTAVSDTKCIIITLGTAFVFKLLSSGAIVNNCHKLPASQFERTLLTIDQIVNDLENAFNSILTLNPKIKIVLTVSPVRHIRDGLVNNQKSKSQLISAAHLLCNMFDNCQYFPSYEIMMDELRDYRFYAEDMIHPSDLAVKIIINKFLEHHYQIDQLEILNQFENLTNEINHKALHPKSNAYLGFLETLNSKVIKLSSDYPYVDLEKEKNLITQRILQFQNE